jgi:hypothetical protein
MGALLELQVRGWTVADAASVAGIPGVERWQRLDAGNHAVSAAATPTPYGAPLGSLTHILIATARSEATLRVLAGSHGLSGEPADSLDWMCVSCVQGQQVLLDGRLLFKVDRPDRWDLWLASLASDVERRPAADDDYFLRQGYTQLPGAMSADRVATLRTALDLALLHDRETWGEAELDRIGQHGALRNLADVDPAFADLLHFSPVTPLLERVMSPGWVIQAFDGLVLLPSQGRFPWDYHTDLECLLGVALPRDRSCPAVNALFYLDHVTVENGATWIVPNSHLSAARDFDRTELAELSIPATGQAGDVLIFDARLWHCAGHNRSAAPRRLIKALYCEPWIRPQMDYTRATRPEIWSNLPGEVRRLLGEGAAPPASVAELRMSLAPPQP